jgi:hypothetical protein
MKAFFKTIKASRDTKKSGNDALFKKLARAIPAGPSRKVTRQFANQTAIFTILFRKSELSRLVAHAAVGRSDD